MRTVAMVLVLALYLAPSRQLLQEQQHQELSHNEDELPPTAQPYVGVMHDEMPTIPLDQDFEITPVDLTLDVKPDVKENCLLCKFVEAGVAPKSPGASTIELAGDTVTTSAASATATGPAVAPVRPANGHWEALGLWQQLVRPLPERKCEAPWVAYEQRRRLQNRRNKSKTRRHHNKHRREPAPCVRYSPPLYY